MTTAYQTLKQKLEMEMARREKEDPGHYTNADAFDAHINGFVEHVARSNGDWWEWYMGASDTAYRRLVIAVQKQVIKRFRKY